MKESFKVNGISVNNIRYADDMDLVANSRENLCELLQALKRKVKREVLTLTKRKLKVGS